MDRHKYKIYCAGPLFNPKERETMSEIAAALEAAGYRVFLPHKDGLQLGQILPVVQEHGLSYKQASEICNKAIFALDVFQIVDGDGIIVNVNGRVPDEGAMVEAGIAWAHGKALVIFNTDARSLIQGNCNPMVMGLADFKWTTNYDEIITEFDQLFASGVPASVSGSLPVFEIANRQGRQISECLATRKPMLELTKLIMKLFGDTNAKIQKVGKGIVS